MDSIDIKPSPGSIRVYENMAYTHWGALGEFVDNSVQSFLNHKRALQKVTYTHVGIKPIRLNVTALCNFH